MLTCSGCGRANPADALFCMGCAAPLRAIATAREVRKTVTALFCDLVGSTTLGETHDPEVLRPLLERYFAVARGAVERHGGRVEKFIGDAVSAVFGLPVAHEDDALRAVRAGMEIQARLEEIAASSPFPFAARIGITTGEVLVPGGGAPLIGDTMNTASRLQSSAEPGSALIGEPTWQLVRDAVVAEPVEPLQLKGKAEAVPAYRVLRVASLSPMRTRRLDAPMVGRRRESILLEGAFERAASDRACQLFTVLGSAGAGKSRLVEEFLSAHADGDAEILRGRCLPYGEGITWYPVTEALRGTLGLADFADEETIRTTIQEAVAGEEHAAAIEANLARLFAAGEGGAPEETSWAIRRFLESRGRERPLVLVLDDIHWGEPMFLDFVEHIADWSRDASILLLCMARPDLLDVRPAWGGGKTNATTISLAPLSDGECGTLIEGLLGSLTLPADVRARIAMVAEGNPLFVEETLRMLVDDGWLVRDETSGEWAATGDLADVHVPPTISALLSARLDRLSDPEHTVLEAASVAGKAFHQGAVAALLPDSARPDLSVHLRSLTRKELITPERSSLSGEDAYRFRHLLIRDAAYDAIPKVDRSTLHRAFADWLEGVAGERIVEQDGIVGYHLERAYRYREELGLPEDRDLRLRAAKALGSAGARSLDGGDVAAAAGLLRPAADLARGDRIELEILVGLAYALVSVAGYDAARSVVTRLAEAAAKAGDAVYEIQARMFVFEGNFFANPEAWDVEVTMAFLDEALHTLRAHGATQVTPRALAWLVMAESARGNMARSVELSSEGLDVALGLRDRLWIGISLNNVMDLLTFGPAPLSRSLERANEYLRTFAGERAIQATVLRELALVQSLLGRSAEARADAGASRAIIEELGQGMWLPYYAQVDAYAAWHEGDLVTAEARFREGTANFKAAGDRFNLGLYGPPLARVLLGLDRTADAEATLVDFRDNRAYPAARANGLSIAAVIAARRGEFEEALRLAAEAEALVEPTDCLIDQGDISLDRAEVLLLAGRPADARAAAEDALARFGRKEHAIGTRRARTFLAVLPG